MKQPSSYADAMLEHHPTYVLAAIVAILTAVSLRLIGLPAPWPPAIALYVYGMVAWPVLRDRLPATRPAVYIAIWLSASLVLMMYEALGAAAAS
jgi:hypothetical protein